MSHQGSEHRSNIGSVGAHPQTLGTNLTSNSVQSSHSTPAVQPTTASAAANGSQPGQMQQAHAIHYVTKIRNRFSNEPDTYR